MPKKLIFNNFVLKIIALMTMTFDHIGYALGLYYGIENPTLSVLFSIFRFIGRLSLSLFCFLIVEGVLHTSNIKKYLIRLGIVAAASLVVQICFSYIPSLEQMGFNTAASINIFIDLLLGAIGVYCLKNENQKIKLLALIPLLYCITSFIFDSYEAFNPETKIWIIPFFLRTESGFFGVSLCLGFYLAYIFKNMWFNYQTKKLNIDYNQYNDTDIERFTINVFSVIILVVVTSIYFVLYHFVLNEGLLIVDPSFSIISGAFILFYNGKRGYNKAWFKYGCYLYYPIHLLIIFGIFEIISIL